MDVRAGLDKYWASEAGIAERKRRSGDAFLAPRRAGGFGDGRLISTGLNDHHASDAGAVTRGKISDGASQRSISLVDTSSSSLLDLV